MSAADQLSSSDPADWPVAPGWQPLVDGFFGGAVGQKLQALSLIHIWTLPTKA